jgi:hypothetical protein
MQLHRRSSSTASVLRHSHGTSWLIFVVVRSGGRETSMNGSQPFKYLTSDPVLAATQPIVGSVP